MQLTWFDALGVPLRREHLDMLLAPEKEREKHLKIVKEKLRRNTTKANFHHAWTHLGTPTEYPFAIPTTNIHPRMSSQSSRFTIHGAREESMIDMNLGTNILCKYKISDEAIDQMKDDLRILGITHSTLFPELDGLAVELSQIY